MTTFSYTLVLDDSESIALEAALDMLLERCEHELESGPRAPFWAWKQSASRIKSRLYEHTRQTSGQLIDPVTGETSIWIASPESHDGNLKE